jgi:hypothetical protein
MRVKIVNEYSLESRLKALEEKVDRQGNRLAELASEIEKLKEKQEVPKITGKSREKYARHEEHAKRFMQFRSCMKLVQYYSNKEGDFGSFPKLNVKQELSAAIAANTFLRRKAEIQESDSETSETSETSEIFPTDKKPYPKCIRESYRKSFSKQFLQAIEVTIPSSIASALKILGQRNNVKDLLTWDGIYSTNLKVRITWLVCFVRNILPDTREEGWERFQCSHLCTNGRCATEEHLIWESAKINRERGNSYCRNICSHMNCTSGLNDCECRKRHFPPCI